MTIDVQPTAETIRNAARILMRASEQLMLTADVLEYDHNLDHVSEAMHTITNAYTNLRLDLFVTRPLRAVRS